MVVPKAGSTGTDVGSTLLRDRAEESMSPAHRP